MKNLANKIALITGAARGIGAETGRLLADHGATVYLADILIDQTRQVAAEIIEKGGQAIALELDVTSGDSWQTGLNAILNNSGRLDTLVNNAGYFLGKSYEEASLEEWQKLVDINMTSVFLGTRTCAPALRESGKLSEHGSAIINVSSIAGLVGAPNDALYSMCKGGVTIFTKSTALSFANQGDRVRVNSVHPGVVDTAMGELAIAAQARRTGVTELEKVKQLSAERHPLGRIAETGDIAQAILFLASDDSAFMTGVSMPVDGGYTAQ